MQRNNSVPLYIKANIDIVKEGRMGAISPQICTEKIIMPIRKKASSRETLVLKSGSTIRNKSNPVPVEPVQHPKAVKDRSKLKLDSRLPAKKQSNAVEIVTISDTIKIGAKNSKSKENLKLTSVPTTIKSTELPVIRF